MSARIPRYEHARTPVVLAVEHTLLREGLGRIIREDPALELAGEAADGAAALRLTSKLGPALVIVEPGLPGRGVAAFAGEARARCPLAGVVVVSLTEDDDLLLSAMRAGARGLLDPSADATQLLDCLHEVAAGRTFVPSRLAGRLLQKFASREPAPAAATRPGGLTDRELEVLGLLATGLTNRQIAERLVITENTVRTHLRSVMQKLNARNRVQLAAYALAHGLAGARSEDADLLSTA